MTKLIFSARFYAAPEAVFAFHADARNLERLSLPPGKFHLVEAATPTREGDLQRFTIGAGPFRRPWHARIAALVPGHSMTDVQELGPLRTWRHSHVVWPDGAGTMLVDHIEFRSGNSVFNRLLDRTVLAAGLRLAFAFRHRRTRQLLGEPAAEPH